MYIARGPNDASRPTDWGTSAFAVNAQAFLVLSVRRNADRTVATIDGVTTSVGTSEGGRFSIRVPTVTTSGDAIVVVAAAGNGSGGISYVVASPGFPSAGMQTPGITPPAPSLWQWEWPTGGFVSGDTLTITEGAGSGAARIFDYLRYAYSYTQNVYGRGGHPLVAWLQYGTSWRCGKCMGRQPTTLFGSSTAPGLPFEMQGYFDGGIAQSYWADPVTAHEFGHWVMQSFGVSPGEAGPHFVGSRVYPGMAWSEGFATWFSADLRRSPLYYDKQPNAAGTGTSFFWLNLAARQYSGPSWTRPVARNGLGQLIDENEVAAMMWTMSSNLPSPPTYFYQALASRRMLGPAFARGYRRTYWSLDTDGSITNVIPTTTPAPHLADFLDALVCSGFSRPLVDGATQPSVYYPYPSASPLCL